MEHNYLYWLSRRIALEMCDHAPTGREMSSFSYLNTHLSTLNRYGALPFTHYSKDDVFTLEGDLEYRFNVELLPEKEEILKHFPSADYRFWENALVDTVRAKDIEPAFNGLSEDLLRKAVYMRTHIPYVGVKVNDKDIFTTDDLRSMTGEQLISVIYAVEAYDMVLNCYGIGIDFPEQAEEGEMGNVYISKYGDKSYLPLKGNALEFVLNTDEPDKDAQEYEL